MDEFQQAVAVIESIKSVEDTEELLKLQTALDNLFQTPHPELAIETLFGLFEHFPVSDAYGIFWSVLHGLEHLPNYEPHLRESVRRQPMEFTLTMVSRILNSNLPHNKRHEWLALLGEVIASPRANEAAKEHAQRIVEHQSKGS